MGIMYCKHFGIDSKPFSITPDPRFLYLSDRHREALAHLLYGVGEGGGFVQLTGEVGTGKTLLCRALLEQLPEAVDVALILNPKLTGLELVAAVCDELKVEYPRDTESLKVLVDRLNLHLLGSHAAGRRTVVVIDEAQNLSTDVLEQVRLLTNLETAHTKLLQIILIGQPELQELLARDELRQLAQRITARYHLGELDRDEARTYIAHRLRVAGGHADLFTPDAVDEVYRLSGGVPRLINVICDRALLGAYVEDRRRVDRRIVRRAAEEVLPEVRSSGERASPWPWAAAAAVVAAVAAGLWLARAPVPEVTAAAPVAMQPAQNSEQPTDPDMPAGTGAAAVPESQPAQAVPDTVESDSVASAEPEALPPPDVTGTESAAPMLGERLAAAVDENAELRVWSGLFRLWGAELYLDEGRQPCDQALRDGLRCFIRSGNWTQLRSFDRPAILQMIAPDGQRVPLLLRGLEADGKTAVVELGGEVLRLPITEIDAHWHGQYMLLWRPPVGSETLRIGSRGDDVLWLRGLLDRLQPGSAEESAAPNLYDAALVERVKAFQSQHALEPDGVVGLMTLMHLNSADVQAAGPRLSVPETADRS